MYLEVNITTVEINSGVHLLKSEIRQVPLFTSGGLGLGLKNMVLFTLLTLNYLFRFVTCIKDELLNIIYQSTPEITLIQNICHM